MNKDDKIETIIKFITSYPGSTATRTILQRHYMNNNEFETSHELGIELKNLLLKKDNEEIDFCYYLVK